MPMGNYKVQLVSRTSGEDRWVAVQAASREDAIRQVAELGEIVGDALLESVAQPAVSSPADSAISAATVQAEAESISPLPALLLSWAVGIVLTVITTAIFAAFYIVVLR